MNDKYTEEPVLWVRQHSTKLISFAIRRPSEFRFQAGQFARLGVREGEGFLWRAYSVVSAEYEEILEFIAVLIPEGAMSQHLAKLQVGDRLLLDKNATGFLLPERFVDGDELIMLATGSGAAPFISQLQNPSLWQRFHKIAFVHAVARREELVFSERIHQWRHHPLIGEYIDQLRYVTVTTQDSDAASLHQRIPALIDNQRLADALGMTFSQPRTRFMICGNPAMVKDTFAALIDAGFQMHRNRVPGQILMENGF